MSDTGEGPISDGGVLHRTSVPPDPLSTALCAPSAPLTKAPAGKRGWREWGIHPSPPPSSPLQCRLAAPPPLGGGSQSQGLCLSLLSLPQAQRSWPWETIQSSLISPNLSTS